MGIGHRAARLGHWALGKGPSPYWGAEGGGGRAEQPSELAVPRERAVAAQPEAPGPGRCAWSRGDLCATPRLGALADPLLSRVQRRLGNSRALPKPVQAEQEAADPPGATPVAGERPQAARLRPPQRPGRGVWPGERSSPAAAASQSPRSGSPRSRRWSS